MPLPSFQGNLYDNQKIKPSIYILAVHHIEKAEQPPIAWLLVERKETIIKDPDGSIYESSIQIFYERIDPTQNFRIKQLGNFAGSYARDYANSSSGSVSLTSSSKHKSAVFLDLPGLEGQHIGTYLLNEIVRWVKQWPDANVRPIELIKTQAQNENSKNRRNRFYEQFGLVFAYEDAGNKAGLSFPMHASDLNEVQSWRDNIQELDIREYMHGLLRDQQYHKIESERLKDSLNILINIRKYAEENPIKWMMQQLWESHKEKFIAIILTLVVITIIRLKY